MTNPYASGFGYNTAFEPTGFQYGNGLYASFGFSPDRLQLNCLDYSPTNRNGTCTHDGTTKFGLTYSYGAAGSNDGQIASITDSVDNGRSATYTYDPLLRVSTAVTTGSTAYPNWGLSWTYDRYGNRTAQTVTAGQAPGPLTPTDPATNHINASGYTYDANGNLTVEPFVPSNNNYTYDGENRLVSFASGSTSGTYTYDGKNLRVKKVLGSTTTVYVFSGAKVIAEYANATLSKEYVYSGSQLLATVVGGTTTYHHADHLSVRISTNASGTKVGDQGHFPFGETWYLTNTTTKWQFTSYERDAESGNDYAIARYGVNRVGRFSSPDPLGGFEGNPQTWNRYAYVANDPVRNIDPSGRLQVLASPDEGNLSDEAPYWSDLGSDPFNLGIGGGGGRDGDCIYVLKDPCQKQQPKPANNGRNCTPSSASAGQYVAATAQVAAMTSEFFSGLGPGNLTFDPGSSTSQVMAQSGPVQDVLNSYYMTGQTSGLYTFGGSGYVAAGGNPVAQFVGSFRWSIAPGDGGINLSLTNTTSFRSLTYDMGPQWQRGSIPTPMGNTHQTYNITAKCQ